MVGGLGVIHYIVYKLRERWGLFKTKVPLILLPVLTYSHIGYVDDSDGHCKKCCLCQWASDTDRL